MFQTIQNQWGNWAGCFRTEKRMETDRYRSKNVQKYAFGT